MARLIEVQAAQALPASFTLEPGDLLLFQASGGHLLAGAGVVELLGAFLPGTMAPGGAIVSPMGAPNTVLFLARQPGQARIGVVRGDPWSRPEAQAEILDLVVRP
jgi:hypothetical protein